jgi:hypothetical protein
MAKYRALLALAFAVSTAMALAQTSGGGGTGGGGGGTPGGSTTQMQFNNSGAFGGSNLTWDGTTLGMTTGKVYFGDTSLSPSLGNLAQYNFRTKPTVEIGVNQTAAMMAQIVPNYGVNKPLATATASLSEGIANDAFSLGFLYGNISASYAEGTGAIGEMVGLTNVAQITSDATSNVTRVSGTDTAGENWSPSGVAGSLIGLQAVYANGGAGSATNAYGVLVKSPSGEGSNNNITNAYGVYIQAQDRGTNKYNFYSAGASASNLFEGKVTAGSFVDSGLTASTSPICPNGSGGAFTTTGCVGISETVSFSATPTFSASTDVSEITLTGNITSFTLAAGLAGQRKILTFCQDGSGSRTVAGPANVHGLFTVGTTASKCSAQLFHYSTTQTAWLSDGPGTINE